MYRNNTLASCNDWHCISHNHAARSADLVLFRHFSHDRKPTANLLRPTDDDLTQGHVQHRDPFGPFRWEGKSADELEDAIVGAARDFEARASDLATLAEGHTDTGLYYKHARVAYDGQSKAVDGSYLACVYGNVRDPGPGFHYVIFDIQRNDTLLWQAPGRHLYLGLTEIRRAAQHHAEDLRTLLSRLRSKRISLQTGL